MAPPTALDQTCPSGAGARSHRPEPYNPWRQPITVDVFTETGAWVGTAPAPDEIGELLDTFEERQAARGE